MADMLRSGFCKACSLCTESVLADKNSEERPTMTDGGHSSKFGGVHQGCDDHNLEQRRQVRQQRFARSAATETESGLSGSKIRPTAHWRLHLRTRSENFISEIPHFFLFFGFSRLFSMDCLGGFFGSDCLDFPDCFLQLELYLAVVNE
ncbi:unnamed protein product [Cuscuta epithymum]|uniref:Uncharacterized protein n=1 Tax=Cuscuta epithymum TaxID=186058 RepID=A0AAV0C4A4_9ASTE|nr:unnamed protein product [Cuscuta epithymum]